MKTFRIAVHQMVERVGYVDIEAEDRDEAIRKFEAMAYCQRDDAAEGWAEGDDMGDIDWYDIRKLGKQELEPELQADMDF